MPNLTSFIKRIHLQVTNCEKDAQNLFNFHLDSIYKTTRHFYISQNRFFYVSKSDGSVYFTEKLVQNAFTQNLTTLEIHFEKNKPNNNFLQGKCKSVTAKDGFWYVVSASEVDKDFRLEKGQFVRFGKQVLKIAQLGNLSSFYEEKKNENAFNETDKQKQTNETENESENKKCSKSGITKNEKNENTEGDNYLQKSNKRY